MKLLATLMISLLAYSTARPSTPLADSVRVWFAEGNRAAWLNAMQAMQVNPERRAEAQAASLPEPLGLASLPRSERPVWAQVHDTLLWNWLVASEGMISFRNEFLGSSLGSDLSPREQMNRARVDRVTPWKVVAGGALLALIAMSWALKWPRWNVYQPTPRSDAFPSVHAAFLLHEWTPEARHEWEQFKAQALHAPPPLDPGVALLLNASERELMGYIAQDLTIEQASKHMACSVSYLYNLRSSIRQKLNLSANANLNQEIRRLSRGE